MAKIPFDIKFRPQIESGEYKVETRDGRSVRIVCWDASENKPILAIIPRTGVEFFHNNGLVGKGCRSYHDLFIVTPEPELTEFESALFSAFSDAWQQYLLGEEINVKQWVREHSTELLDLANKELKKHEFAIFTREEFDAEIEEAKAEALKDLPMWKKCAPSTIYNTKFNLVDIGCGRYLMVDGYQIDIDLLLKKLPGFKED